MSVVLPKVTSLLRFPEIRPLPNLLPHWHRVNLFCNFHRTVGHSMDCCFTLRGAIQDLIDRKVIMIDTHEASTAAPPPASTPALGLAPSHPSIVHQPLPKHSNSGGAGTSGIHSLFPSGLATSVVDPSELIHDISKPFPFSLYYVAVAGSELGVHMIRPHARSERSTARPTMQPQAQAPIHLLGRPQPKFPVHLLGRPQPGSPAHLLGRP